MNSFVVSTLLNLRKRLRGANPDCERLRAEADQIGRRNLFDVIESGEPAPLADSYVSLIRPDLENLASALEARDVPGAILHVEAALLALYS